MSGISANRQVTNKEDIVRLINEANAETNLKFFVEKLHGICFERCIASPGTSLSRNDEACVANCVRKYAGVYDTVSKEWNNSMQRMRQGM